MVHAIEQGLIDHARRVQEVTARHKARDGIAVLEGEINVEGQQITVQVGFQESFPLSVPLVYLIPWNALGFIPHVEADGYVCYVQGEGLLVDRHNPFGVLEEALERAVDTLAKGVRGENRPDFADEFEAYWRRNDGVQSIQSFVTPGNEARKIFVAEPDAKTKRKTNVAYVLVADSEETLRAYWSGNGSEAQTHRTALYVPFEEGTDLIPPRSDAFWTLDDVRRIVEQHTSTRTQRRFAKLVRKWKHDEVVVFGLPRPSGGRALFAIRFIGVEDGHPLHKGTRVKQLVPLALERRDKAYLLPRGGASRALGSKRVALVGCGSVGGFLALELARAGVGKLTLIDHEQISVENSFRHVLGRHATGQYKPEALKAEIERKLPYVQVKAITKRVESAINEGVFNPADYALVVVALGIPALSLYLNDILHANPKAPPAVYAWVEAYGIGGHALLSRGQGEAGCLECLFTRAPDDDDDPLFNRASFAAPGQSFAKDLSGCGSPFMPYGSLDAVRTAELAARLAVQTLTDPPAGNPIMSWKGSSGEFLAAGFRLSGRYTLTEDELFAQRSAYHNPNCPVCALAGALTRQAAKEDVP